MALERKDLGGGASLWHSSSIEGRERPTNLELPLRGLGPVHLRFEEWEESLSEEVGSSWSLIGREVLPASDEL